jgi:thiamine-monophosphate kinase
MEIARTEISDLGEFKLIELLTESFPQFYKSTVKGLGDDAAVIDFGKESLLITNLLVEEIHFDLSVSLKHLGYKAVRLIYRIYAMNTITTK